jgi:outer membrane protein assembly factor BamB
VHASLARAVSWVVALQLLVVVPAHAVVPSLTPVIVALLPQILLFLLTTLLLLVRPRTWFRVAGWSIRHPLPALAFVVVIAGLAWGLTWLFSGGPGGAEASTWKAPTPACGYEGQLGGPGHTYASDSRGADPVGPNLEPDVRWIRTGAAVKAVTSDGKRAYTLFTASTGGTTIAAWDIADGKRAWKHDLPGENVGPPIVPADGSGRVVVWGHGGMGGWKWHIAGGVEPHSGTFSVIPFAEVALRSGVLVVPSEKGLYCEIPDDGTPRTFPSAPWVAEAYGRGWTMLALDDQARVHVGNGSELACLDLVVRRELWRRKPGGRIGAPTWSDGWLYVAHESGGNSDPEIVCLDPETPDGAIAWRLPLPGLRAEIPLAAGKTRLVVPLAKPSGPVLALVDTLRRSCVREIPLGSAPAQPVVLVNSGDGAAYVLDAEGRVSRVALKDGSITWTVNLEARATGPMILSDGVLLVPTDKGVAVLE